ncbi:MAG: FAD-dependent oxidoreductase [Butyricicoccus porcorum]
MINSIWADTAALPTFESLDGDCKTDVLIIGGGMAGLLCTYLLKQAGVDCLLIEADRICCGVTRNTTAKLTVQHGLIYDKMLRRFGSEKTRMYLEANEAALAQYRRLCQTIDCDFEEKDSFVYSIDQPKKLEQELEALHRIGFRAEYADQLPLPFDTAGAVRVHGQAQFHPLKFAAEIARGLPIREQTTARAFDGHTVVTNRGGIAASNIIVTTHFPMLNKHGAYFLKLYQHRSYVLGLERAPDVHGMYVDEAKGGMSFRNADGLLLLGGGGHRTGKPGGGWAELERFVQKHYPDAQEHCRWVAQDCMSLDDIPYIGQYSRTTPGLYVATGFHKWGMTSSMTAAMLLCDMVQGKQSDHARVFSPSRTMLRPQLVSNALEATANLLTLSKPRCPHMGCALKWNAQEHSWDCPCHGSRFAEDGTLLDNPATGNLKTQAKK